MDRFIIAIDQMLCDQRNVSTEYLDTKLLLEVVINLAISNNIVFNNEQEAMTYIIQQLQHMNYPTRVINDVGYEYLKQLDDIKYFKHLIGCEVVRYGVIHTLIENSWKYGIVTQEDGAIHYRNPYFTSLQFCLDDETLGTYEEYMQLHYPEFYFVWKEQL